MAHVGEIPVDVHLSTAAPLSFIGQRLFDELRWRNLGSLVSLKTVASADAVAALAKYLGLVRQDNLRGFVFKLVTPSGQAMDIRVVVVAELRGFRVVLGTDFLDHYQPMRVAMFTRQGSFIEVDAGIKIPLNPKGVMMFPGAMSDEAFDLAIDVFTDGACAGNGGQGMAGYAVVFPGFGGMDWSGRLAGELQTSNRAEFAAFVRALKAAKKIDKNGHRSLRVYTDSQLLIDSVENYLAKWRANGWKTHEGEPVKNRDLLEAIHDLMSNKDGIPRVVEFVHVPAHSGEPSWTARWNHEADARARDAARTPLQPQPPQPQPPQA